MAFDTVVAVLALGFYYLVYTFVTPLLAGGLISGDGSLTTAGLVPVVVVGIFFSTWLLTVVETVLIELRLVFFVKSNVEGYLFNWTEGLGYFFYSVFVVYVFAPNCLFAFNAGFIYKDGLLTSSGLGYGFVTTGAFFTSTGFIYYYGLGFT